MNNLDDEKQKDEHRSSRKKEIEDLSRSRIVCLRNLLVLENMQRKQDYYDVEEDVYEECRKYGRVRHIIIPKPYHMHMKRLPLHV